MARWRGLELVADAQVAPLFESVPPHGYGGTERVIAALCDGLTEAGHDVTLFATGSSETQASLVPMVGSPLRTRMSRAEMIDVAPHIHLRMLADVNGRADEFDVIHAHTDLWTLPFVDSTSTPTVLTMHGRLDLDIVRRVVPQYPNVPLVSISDHQRRPLWRYAVNWAGTVYNGLDLERYLCEPVGDGGYLAFVGRINAEKRPDLAVELARRSGRLLRVAAKVDPLDVELLRDRDRAVVR
jgi:glycosyltransferase involved in cell wall biosynthesis